MNVSTIAPLLLAASTCAAAMRFLVPLRPTMVTFAPKGDKRFGRREADAVGGAGNQDLLARHRTVNSCYVHRP